MGLMGNDKMKRVAGILTICSLAISGCTGSSEADNTEQSREPLSITVLAGQSTSDAGIEDMIDEAMAEKFPDIRLEWECVDWGESFSSQLKGRIAAGDIPDIIIGKSQDVHTYADLGILASIQVEGMDRIQKDVLQCVTEDGIVYGIPYDAWYQGVVYNKNIFQNLGLTVPETLEDLHHIVDVCRQNGITPFAAHYQESWKIANMNMQFFIESIFRKDPEWGNKFRQGINQFSGNPSIIMAMEQNKYIYENTWDDAAVINQSESDTRFAKSEAAMYLTGTWSLQTVEQYTSENTAYGIFPYPGEDRADLIKEINMTFMMSKSTRYADEISQIFGELLNNWSLMKEILGFTQSYPVVSDVDAQKHSSIQEDINSYEKKGWVVDATIGNNQLIWDFQNNFAIDTQKWLKGEKSLEEILKAADEDRDES